MLNMDRLFERVGERGPVCIGLDTAPEYIPPRALAAASDAEAILAFNRALIAATSGIAACYKVQIACYEALGLAGMRAYAGTLRALREAGLLVIADIKRGDIADTAARYAKAHFTGDFEADFVTLSPYMGMDTLSPWLEYAERQGKGAFVLVRTSNSGMRDFEYRELTGGGRLCTAVGDKLQQLAEKSAGLHGYGAFGAVIGCTEAAEAAEMRAAWGSLFFLIPGYGAQGGAAQDAARLLRNGNGGVVNASRSILRAWSARTAPETATLALAAEAAQEAAIAMRDALVL
jgi:orotidine-5'-phosphate decarboxylase